MSVLLLTFPSLPPLYCICLDGGHSGNKWDALGDISLLAETEGKVDVKEAALDDGDDDDSLGGCSVPCVRPFGEGHKEWNKKEIILINLKIICSF